MGSGRKSKPWPRFVASGGYHYSGHDNQDAKEVIAEHEAERIFRLGEAA
jgi:hypothetical protein